MWWKEETELILTFVIRETAFKIFGKIRNKEALAGNFEKTQVALGWPNRYKFYSASRNTYLESLKIIFNVLV